MCSATVTAHRLPAKILAAAKVVSFLTSFCMRSGRSGGRPRGSRSVSRVRSRLRHWGMRWSTARSSPPLTLHPPPNVLPLCAEAARLRSAMICTSILRFLQHLVAAHAGTSGCIDPSAWLQTVACLSAYDPDLKLIRTMGCIRTCIMHSVLLNTRCYAGTDSDV